jgi:hypothetical protein
VLTIDAKNARALAGLKSLADQLIVSARDNLTAGRYADAVIALNGARRIDPSHRGLAAIEGDLRRELQTLAVRGTCEERARSSRACQHHRCRCSQRRERIRSQSGRRAQERSRFGERTGQGNSAARNGRCSHGCCSDGRCVREHDRTGECTD